MTQTLNPTGVLNNVQPSKIYLKFEYKKWVKNLVFFDDNPPCSTIFMIIIFLGHAINLMPVFGRRNTYPVFTTRSSYT